MNLMRQLLQHKRIAADMENVCYNDTPLACNFLSTFEVNMLTSPELAKPFDDFVEFDIDGDMPNNGDVAMMLGQYINCMEVVKKDNVHPFNGRWYWKTDDDPGSREISTSAPADLKR